MNSFTLPVPKELMKMVNVIHAKGKHLPDLFDRAESHGHLKSIRDKLDLSVSIDEEDPQSVAAVLIDFLKTLVTPILPEDTVE